MMSVPEALKDAIANFIATNDLAAPQLELLERVLDAPKERELADRIPLYPPRTAKRESLCQLRWRHLQSVSTMARSNDSRADLFKVLRKNYEHFFRKSPPSPKRRGSERRDAKGLHRP
jgi:hypothetical protein